MNTSADKVGSKAMLEDMLSKPSEELVKYFAGIEGDIMFLGVSGKIGPSLARMAVKACKEAGVSKRIYGAAIFASDQERSQIEAWGIETFHGNLLDTTFIQSLPKAENVYFLAGMKFGSEENLSLTWAVNAFLPALIADYYKESRIVAFSTGCVYPLVAVDSGGSLESDMPQPVGEYAQSCLGRERMFEYGSLENKTKVCLIRLNYAVELRYGVLVDIATRVKNKQDIDLSMGYFNIIWQGDVNDMVLRSLDSCESPAKILNITGPETLSVREVATAFGKHFGLTPTFINEEAKTALLNNSNLAFQLFGKPKTAPEEIIKWIAHWIDDGMDLLGKPTHYEVRDGKY